MIITLMVGLVGAGPGNSQNSDELEIHKAVMRLPEAWNRHDMRAFASQFAEDADFVNVAGSWWRGRAEIEQKHATVHATIFRESTLSIDDIQIRFLTPEIAIAHVATSLAGQKTAEGALVPPRKTLLTLVLQKLAGKWLIATSQNTDIRPPGPPIEPARP